MKEINAQEAYDLMQSDPEVIYLDVRSVPEFEAGHAAGAINIPIAHFTPGSGMSPNQDFPAVVEANVPRNAKLVVGCKSGGRSARACEMMSQMGYGDVTNIRGGFGGAMDNFGRVIEPGTELLHIDGWHKFSAVRADFRLFRRHLNRGALVMFHDVNTVFRGMRLFWKLVSAQYPSYLVPYGHGLGIIRVD